MPPLVEIGGVPKELKRGLPGKEKRKIASQGGAFWAVDGLVDKTSIIIGFDNVSGETLTAAQDSESNWYVVLPLDYSSPKPNVPRRQHGRTRVGRGGSREKMV